MLPFAFSTRLFECFCLFPLWLAFDTKQRWISRPSSGDWHRWDAEAYSRWDTTISHSSGVPINFLWGSTHLKSSEKWVPFSKKIDRFVDFFSSWGGSRNTPMGTPLSRSYIFSIGNHGVYGSRNFFSLKSFSSLRVNTMADPVFRISNFFRPEFEKSNKKFSLIFTLYTSLVDFRWHRFWG